VAVSHIENGLFLVEPNFMQLDLADASICADETLEVNVNLADGFLGSISLSVEGLPSGATATFSQNGLSAPTSTLLSLSNWPNNDASYTITVNAVGTHYNYQREVTVNTAETREWYADLDGDGFGDVNQSLTDCVQPENYVLDNTDCDDTRNDAFPGAAGNQSGIDNDCNGVIDPDESLPCPGDFNLDGVINIGDLLLLLADIGCLSECVADMNGDENVNTADLTAFLSLYGTSCD
jgi:hypothetical protein